MMIIMIFVPVILERHATILLELCDHSFEEGLIILLGYP